MVSLSLTPRDIFSCLERTACLSEYRKAFTRKPMYSGSAVNHAIAYRYRYTLTYACMYIVVVEWGGSPRWLRSAR